MKLHQLRDIIAVAEQGSLRAASRHLQISKSSITKSVQSLEKELGVPVLERHKRGAALTPLGALFVRRARAASNELARAQDELDQHRGAGTGRVVGCLSTVPHLALLPSVITPFGKRYPDIELTILEALGFSGIEAQLRSGDIDFYIGIEPAAKLSREFRVEKLFENPRYVIARAGHPLAGATSLRELAGASWVLSSRTYAGAGFAALFRKHHCPVPTKVTCAGSILGQMIFIANSEMIAIAPRQVVDTDLMRIPLVRIPVREFIDAPSIVMVRRAALPLTPAAEYFCDLVRRVGAGMVQTTSRRTRG